MDFLISDDGELIAYHGAGGAVVIPEGVRFIARDGVFDPQVKITTLTLPSTLLGHKHKLGSDHQAHVLRHNESAAGDTVELYQHDTSKALVANDELFELLSLDLPYLENYEVAEGNLVYRAIDGVLLFKLDFVLDIPKRSPFPFKLECSYQEYIHSDEAKDTFSGPPLAAYLDEEIVTPELFASYQTSEIFDLSTDNLYIFYALKAHAIREEGFPWLPKKNTIVVIPNLHSCDLNSIIVLFALLGFCYRQELFDEEQAKVCRAFLYLDEANCYRRAKHYGLKRVCQYYENLWAQGFVPKPFIENYVDATEQLFASVLYGTVDDVRSSLDFDDVVSDEPSIAEEFVFLVAFAVQLAIRYGGVQKLKCLLSKDRVRQYLQAYIDEISYKGNTRDGIWGVIGNKPTFTRTSALFVNAQGEVRNLSPISVEERLSCFEFLAHDLLNVICVNEWKCFYAYMLGRSDLAATLLDKADLKDFVVNLSQYTSQTDDAEILEYNTTIASVLESNPQHVIAFAKAAKSKGVLIRLGLIHDLAIVVNTEELIHELFPLVYIDHDALEVFFYRIVGQEAPELLQAMLDCGYDFDDEILKRFATIAHDTDNHEMVATLLNYQNHRRKEKDSTLAPTSPLTL